MHRKQTQILQMLLLISVILIWLDNFTVFYPKRKKQNPFSFYFGGPTEQVRSLFTPFAFNDNICRQRFHFDRFFFVSFLGFGCFCRASQWSLFSSFYGAKNRFPFEQFIKSSLPCDSLWRRHSVFARTNTSWKRIKNLSIFIGTLRVYRFKLSIPK